MTEPDDEIQKPRPKRSAKSVQTLRQEVKAKDKFAVAGKSEADAVKHIAETYITDDDSALAFVQWIKGPASSAPPEKPADGKPIETWHRQGNMNKGTEDLLTDQDSAEVRGAVAKPAKGRKK